VQSNFCHTPPPALGYCDRHLLWADFWFRNLVARALGSGRPAITRHSPMRASGVDSSAVSVSSTPMLKSAACAAACARSSAISSTLPSAGFSCLRWFLRSALSLCLCCRVCSFWRFVNVDRPLGIRTPYSLFVAGGDVPQPHRAQCVQKTTSAVRAVAVDGRDSHLVHVRLRRQNDNRHPWDVRTWVWPR